MKLVSNYGSSNWKRSNLQIATLACGVALAAVAIVGGSEVLRDNGDSGSVSPVRVAQPTGPVLDPTDFGSQGIEYRLAQQEARAASAAALQDARGIGQPGEGVESAEATLIDPTDFASRFVNTAPQYSTTADAAFDAMNPSLVQSVPAAAVRGLDDARGIGQPGEGVESVEATLIDPTDFASRFVNTAPQYGTAADAAYATESSLRQAGPVVLSESQQFDLATLGMEETLARPEARVAASAALENARGIGQPGEGVESVEATLIDPTDFGSQGIESVLQAQPAFAPEGSVDYSLPTTFAEDFYGVGLPGEVAGAELSVLPSEAALDYSLPTSFTADFYGTGQSGEGVEAPEATGPLFGTMVDAVYVMEDSLQIP
jgi:hypothetical protein